MNRLISRTARLAGGAVLALASLAAQAANFDFSGQIVYNTDVVQIGFTLSSASDVTLWTDSWQSGLSFDPIVGLYTGNDKMLLQVIDDNDGTIAGAGYFDSGALLTQLPAGTYLLTLGAAGNDPLGPTLADGFLLGGTAPVKLVDWNQPSYDINKNDQKGGVWQLHISGVQQAAVVPEPQTWALMAAGGLLMLAALRKSRRG